jgi:dihydroorotate dehydrogenase
MVRIGRVVWPGPVGIGAGIVKGAAAFVDFSTRADSVEVGSVTRELLPGNKGQTVWKYVDQRAIRHNAGMPNPGARNLVMQFKEVQYQAKCPWGVNVAVSPGIVDDALAAADIQSTVRKLFGGGLKPHWLTVNVSSPDTVDSVELLSDPRRVSTILRVVTGEAAIHGSIPVWLKVGPALTQKRYEELVAVAFTNHLEALVATNTMPDPQGEPVGWAGEPLRAKALAIVWQLARLVNHKIPIIAVGGVMAGKHVKDKLQAGASAVQVVSAVLFKGRDAARDIRREYELLVAAEAERRIRAR